MKFYLTKQAQRAAEGRPASSSKSPKSAPSAPAASAPAVAGPAAQAAAPVVADAGTSRRSTSERSQAKGGQPTKRKGTIAIGGLPRVDLLPPEVRAERRAAVNVRRAWTGVVGLVVLVGVATGTATLYSQSADNALMAAQKQTSVLSTQTGKYAAVKTTQNKVDLIDAARLVGGSTDVDWPSYLAKVQATLPAGMTLGTVTVDSASPVAAYTQATAPLQGQRIATLSFSATSSSLPSVPAWLTSLAKLPGYTDASAGNVSLASNVYTANVVMHIDEKAFSNAYSKKGK